jgi:hypothetical protein
MGQIHTHAFDLKCTATENGTANLASRKHESEPLLGTEEGRVNDHLETRLA